MIYIFKCTNEHCRMFNLIVDEEQDMHEEHEAHCLDCGHEMQRVFTSLPFQFGKADYNKDGSRDLNPDLPHVPSGTKYTHGWSPKEV